MALAACPTPSNPGPPATCGKNLQHSHHLYSTSIQESPAWGPALPYLDPFQALCPVSPFILATAEGRWPLSMP